MGRRVLFIGLLVIGVALLSGCDLLDRIIGAIPGTGDPGGGAVTSVSISYDLAVTLSERREPTYPVETDESTVIMDFFRPYGGTYDAATRTFTNNWDNQVGDFSNTYLEVRLNAAEDAIEYFYARQTQESVWGAWTFANEIRGYDIPYSHTDEGSRYFIATGTDAHLALDRMIYKGWTPAREGFSASSPNTWAYLDYVVIPNVDDVIPAGSNNITIRLNP
ncbi:hypothetical protein JW848_01580 [Candidatus Bipolaricaulota bacterium]|nr:hypothetical protein [Candidatus Bipolaricaulota bacterium]